MDSSEQVKVHITRTGGLTERDERRSRFGGSTYDDYGNVIDSYAVTNGGVTTHVTSTYEIRKEDWLVGLRRTQESTSAVQPTVTRHVEYDYDDRGYLCHSYVEKNHPNPEVPETFTYFHDAEGQARAVTATAAGMDPRTTHIAYERSERVYPAQVWNDLGHSRASVRHPGLGVLVAQADENGVQTHTQYDDLGRPLSIQRDGEAKVSMQYEPRNTAAGDIAGVIVEVTDEAGGFSSTEHDELGRVVKRRHLGFDGSPIEQVARYDLRGRLVSASRPGLGSHPTSSRGSNTTTSIG